MKISYLRSLSFFIVIIKSGHSDFYTKVKIRQIICFLLMQSEQQTPTMVKALTEIVTVEIRPHLVSMSIAEKQNQSGIKYNERLFILVHHEYFGYLSKVKLTDDPSKIDLTDAKATVDLKYLFTVDSEDEILKLKFTYSQQNKLVPKQWFFRMGSQKLANLWKKLLQYQLSMKNKPTPKRKTPTQTPNKSQVQKVRVSPGKINESQVIQKQQKYFRANPPENRQISPISNIKTEETSKYNVINQPQQRKSFENKPPPQQKVFENPLYNENQSQSQAEVKKEEPKPSFQHKKSSKEEPKRSMIKDEIRVSNAKIEEKTQKPEPRNKEEEKKEIQIPKIQIPKQNPPIQERQTFKAREDTASFARLDSFQQTKNSQPKVSNRESDRQFEQFNKPEAEFIKPDGLIIEKEEFRQYHNLQTPAFDDKMLKEEIDQEKSKYYAEKRRRSQKPEILSTSLKKESDQSLKESNKISQSNVKFIETLNEQMDARVQRMPVQKVLYEPGQAQRIKTNYNINTKQNINRAKARQLEVIHDYVVEKQKSLLSKAQQSRKSIKPSWTYRSFVDEETDLLLAFAEHCEQLMKELVNQFFTKKRSDKFKLIKEANGIMFYQSDDIEIKIPLFPNKIMKNGETSQIADTSPLKCIESEFKNYKLLYRLIDNRGNLRVPLANLIEYAGFVGLFKSKSQFFNNFKPSMENIKADIQRINNTAKIESILLQPSSKSKILDLNQHYYDNFKSNGLPKISFKVSFLQQIDSFLIKDPNYESQYALIRYELLQKQFKQKLSQKSSQKQKESIQQTMEQKLIQALNSLQNLQISFTNPMQLSNFLHENGINVRYLGQMYKKAKVPFIKQMILCDIAGRVSKVLFRKSIQELCFQDQNETQSCQSIQEIVFDFLNCILGQAEESTAIWNLLNQYSLQLFQTQINRDLIQKGQFIVNLIYQCGLDVEWKNIKIQSTNLSSKFFSKENVNALKIKTKSYLPVKINHHQIQEKLKTVSSEFFEDIINEFSLKTKQFPLYFKLTDETLTFKKYLANFIQPNVIQWESSFQHLKIYENPQISRIGFQIDFILLEWFLKLHKKQQYLFHFNEICSKIQRIYGEYHPLFSQIYDIFSQFHLKNRQFQDSIAFCKSSLINLTKLCGENHIKISQGLQKLALRYIKAQKFPEAMETLRKGKNCMEKLAHKNLYIYGKMKFNLSALYFKGNLIKQSLKECQNLLQIFEIYEKHSSLEEERAQLFHLLNQLYERENLKHQKLQLGSMGLRKLQYFTSIDNFRLVLKVGLEGTLRTVSSSARTTLQSILYQILFKPSVVKYKKAYNYLKKRANEQTFNDIVHHYFANIDELYDSATEKNIFENWTSFSGFYSRQTVYDFVSLIEEIVYFIGLQPMSRILEKIKLQE